MGLGRVKTRQKALGMESQDAEAGCFLASRTEAFFVPVEC